MKGNVASKKLISDYYTNHREEILVFVAKRLKSMEESEDLVQNVFLRLLTSDKLITEVTLPSLVYTVAKNLIADYWRHRMSMMEYEHYVQTALYIYNNVEMMSVYGVGEIHELLEKGMARLAEPQRRMYRMSVVDGMKVSEISFRTGMAYKSVEHTLYAARKEVREYMRRMLA